MSALWIKNTSESDPRSYEVTWLVSNTYTAFDISHSAHHCFSFVILSS